nr:MAG TPA: hypothetical protein [Caudoviricetes sp.]
MAAHGTAWQVAASQQLPTGRAGPYGRINLNGGDRRECLSLPLYIEMIC